MLYLIFIIIIISSSSSIIIIITSNNSSNSSSSIVIIITAIVIDSYIGYIIFVRTRNSPRQTSLVRESVHCEISVYSNPAENRTLPAKDFRIRITAISLQSGWERIGTVFCFPNISRDDFREPKHRIK